jgi:hypothetical protein
MSRDLEQRYPLRIPTAVVKDPPVDPEPPFRLAGADLDGWNRMPLSKRRLAALGPLVAGREAARLAAIIVAAECAAQGIPYDVALHLCLNLNFTTGQTPRRLVVRQLPSAAEFGYAPPNGRPILTGCCRDPKPRSGAPLGSKLRSYMAPYCDGACAASCPMLKAVRNPEQAVADTDYRAVAESDLWMHQRGYGQVGRLAYEQLALLATLTTDQIVPATSTYVAMRLGGQFNHEVVRRVLKRLSEDGVAPVVETVDQVPHRHVPVLTVDDVRALEQRLGVRGRRASNLRAISRERSRYGDELYEMLSDEEKIDAWNAT